MSDATGETSHEAALAIEPDSNTLRGEVLASLRSAGPMGMTDEEMQRELGLNPSTQRPRRIELCSGRFVEDSGMRRQTASGRRAVVWRAIR